MKRAKIKCMQEGHLPVYHISGENRTFNSLNTAQIIYFTTMLYIQIRNIIYLAIQDKTFFEEVLEIYC